MTEEHDIFLQVSQAPVLMVTDSFLMGILDETEESYVTILACLRKPIFPFVFIAFAALLGGWGITDQDHPPTSDLSGWGGRCAERDEWQWRDRKVLSIMQCV